jgi:phosphohistidine phosphatase SixA
MLKHVLGFVGITLLWAAPVLSQPASPNEWLAGLRRGGYVIVMRHTATHANQADTDPLNIKDITKQRQLTDQGRALAATMGDSMRRLKIAVGQVQTSMFNRAIETGTLLGFVSVTPLLDISEGGLVVTPMENSRRAETLKRLAATPPAPFTNRIIVSHKPNIMDAFGKDWFDVREGEASIFKPDGNGGATLVARVQANDWAKLASLRTD